MQEEVDQKTIALAVKTGKLTAQVLQAAIRKYLAARQKGTGKAHHGQPVSYTHLTLPTIA